MFFSSKKYKVSLNGRSGVTYSEGKRKALIEAELLLGQMNLAIYFNSFHSWQPPFEKDVVTDEERQRMKLNISKELEKKGFNIDWD